MNIPTWINYEIIKSYLEEFREIYKERPIKNNDGGMKSTHMFYCWLTAKLLSPELIVESGTYKGASAWLFKTACPKAKVLSFDVVPEYRTYTTKGVEYYDYDISRHNWINLPSNSLIFFDDHQNAYTRLQQCKWFGFQNVIFEDNYPVKQGDCYSIKKIKSGKGFLPEFQKKSSINNYQKIIQKIASKLTNLPSQTEQYTDISIKENMHDNFFLEKNISEFIEFPPLYKSQFTRWGDSWNDEDYPTSEPVLGEISEEEINSSDDFYKSECKFYTWICYLKLSPLPIN